MKRLLCYLAVLIVLGLPGWRPFAGTDVAKLQPVEAIRVSESRGYIQVETDTGARGRGEDLSAAFADMKETTAGEVFLETAEYLIVSKETISLLPELTDKLRPACSVCIEQGQPDLKAVAPFLGIHEPYLKLKDYRAGDHKLPMLVTQEGTMHLVQP